MTAPFTAGRHAFTVTLRDGAAVQRLRAEQKKNTGADYVATLRRLGFDVGDDGPVSRAKAEEAEAFVRARAAELLDTRCGDIILPDGGRVVGLQPARIAGPGLAPGESGPGQNPVGDPPVPLDLPTPVTPHTHAVADRAAIDAAGIAVADAGSDSRTVAQPDADSLADPDPAAGKRGHAIAGPRRIALTPTRESL